jgi:hypothetical protein
MRVERRQSERFGLATLVHYRKCPRALPIGREAMKDTDPIRRAGTQLTLVRLFVEAAVFAEKHTIEDYPCGWSGRCKCELSIDSSVKGTRTVRRTTDKNGRWCAPKMSTYRERHDAAMFVMVSHPDHLAGWMVLSKRHGVYLSSANGQATVIADPLFSSPPRRKAIGGVMNGQPFTMAASPAAELEAWDVWCRGLDAIEVKIRTAIGTWQELVARA